MTRSRTGLNTLNFFNAAVQTGFGPFVAVWLTENGWNFADIGLALSVGTIAGLAAQLPGGILVDRVQRKGVLTIGSLLILGLSALLLCFAPTRPVVWGAQIAHALGTAVMVPAIAALTLSLCGHDAFSQRLGVNASWGSIGSAAAAVVLGGVTSYWPERWVFVLSAAFALPAIAGVLLIRPSDRLSGDDQHSALLPAGRGKHPPWQIFADPALHMFAVAVVLFQLANASLVPLALGALTRRGDAPGYVVSATIVVPQLVTAALSPWAGSLAQSIGRRPVLVAGFLAVPLRALLFALQPGALGLTALQALDGVSAAILGLMIPLIAADLTERTGYINFAIGSLGLASGLGATFSTSVGGWLAQHVDLSAAFLAMAGVGAAAVALLWLAMPETRPTRVRAEAEAPQPA